MSKKYQSKDNNALWNVETAMRILMQYDEAKEELEKGEELTDDQIDKFIWSEEQMWNVLSALITMKKIQANRRLIAEKEEEKIMVFVKRIMNRLDLKEWSAEDWKAKWKVHYRREYADKETFKWIPKKFFRPNYQAINKMIQEKAKEWKQMKWIIMHEWNLSVSIR